jgi:transcriptional regulator GlxA family with amidase domain
VRHLGASPIAVMKTRRLHFAKKLIDETNLPMGEIAEIDVYVREESEWTTVSTQITRTSSMCSRGPYKRPK